MTEPLAARVRALVGKREVFTPPTAPADAAEAVDRG